jgi:hypothetical protein
MSEAGCVIGLLDGSRDRAQVIAAACDRGVPAQLAERVLTLLAAGGALDDFPAGTYRALPRQLRTRLAPELAAASLAHGDGDGGARILARRRDAYICVYGDGRLGSGIADVLTASGVGEVASSDGTRRDPPAGPDPAMQCDPATRRELAGRQSKTPGQPGRAPGQPGRTPGQPGQPDRTPGQQGKRPGQAAPTPGPALAPRTRPDLAVLTGTPDRELAAWLMRDQIPHLAVAAGEAIGVVGPLVLPARSACLRCLDLTRTDRDPAWPLILAQLAGRQPDPPACDAALAAAVVAQAAAQALVFIDRPGRRAGPVTNGTLELVLPSWQWRRRTWLPHQDCACGRRALA